MKVTFAGTGDAFGSGGRFNTCFHVESRSSTFLIDCGASSMIALKTLEIHPNDIDMILFTHFHGDHFGGLPYFMLDAQFFSKRNNPLTLMGPAGLEERFIEVMEATFPGSSNTRPKFDLIFVELKPGIDTKFCEIQISTAQVRHGPPEEPFHAYRIQIDGKVLAYTGDTEWVDDLIEIGFEADLLIAEAYFFEKKVPLHLDLVTLESKLPLIQPKRLVLTHMATDMLSRLDTISHDVASDGLMMEI